MNKGIWLGLALGAMVAGGVAASAPVNLRQANQERRIDAGRRSGKLTVREAARLKAEQRRIAANERVLRARHGGHLTARDKATIHAQQDRANRRILAQKHNARRGPNKLKL